MKHLAVVGGLMLIMARGKIQRDGEEVGFHAPRIGRANVIKDRYEGRRLKQY